MAALPRVRTCFSTGLFCALVLLAACSSETSSGLYVDVPSAPTTQVSGLITSTASGVAASDVVEGSLAQPTDDVIDQPIVQSVSQEKFDEVEQFYDSYLSKRANVLDQTDDPDSINELVTATGRAELADALAYNTSLHTDERFSAIDSMWLFSNVESISQVDEQTILIRDCTERQEVNALEQFNVYWLTNEVLIDASSGQLQVSEYTTTHNGFLEVDDPVGCAPLSFRERAEAASAQAWTELAEWSRSTQGRTEASLPELIGDPLRQRVLDAVETSGSTQIDETREHSTFAAVGLDTHVRLGAKGADGVVIVVNSCHQFPDGRTGNDTITQSPVADLDAGSEQALRFQVLLDSSRENRIDQVIAIEYLADRCAQ